MRRRSETSGQGTRPKAVQNKNTTKIKKIFPKQGCIFCFLTGYQVEGHYSSRKRIEKVANRGRRSAAFLKSAETRCGKFLKTARFWNILTILVASFMRGLFRDCRWIKPSNPWAKVRSSCECVRALFSKNASRGFILGHFFWLLSERLFFPVAPNGP